MLPLERGSPTLGYFCDPPGLFCLRIFNLPEGHLCNSARPVSAAVASLCVCACVPLRGTCCVFLSVLWLRLGGGAGWGDREREPSGRGACAAR